MSVKSNKAGCLFLIPVPLAPGNITDVIPEYNLLIIRSLRLFIVENIRTARRFLRSAGYEGPLDDANFLILDEHTPDNEIPGLLDNLVNGQDVGLMSESGLPCIADPGSKVTQEAHRLNIQIKALSGPSSIFLGLMASGFNGQSFTFHGYLPIKGKGLKQALHSIENNASTTGSTHIFIEAPYRNQKLFEEILAVCHPETMLCIASELTAAKEWVKTMNIRTWKSQHPDIHKKNAIFLIGRMA